MDKALIAGVKVAKVKPCYYAIAWKDSNEGRLILSKKRILPPRIKQAKAEVGGKKALQGTAYFESGKCVFEKLPTDPTPPKAPILLKLLFKEGTGKKYEVELRDVEQLTPIDDTDDEKEDEEVTSGGVKGPPMPDAVKQLLDKQDTDPKADIARLRTAFEQITKKLKAIATANPWAGGRARELIKEGLGFCDLAEGGKNVAHDLKKARGAHSNLMGVLKAMKHSPGRPHEVKVPLKVSEPSEGVSKEQVAISNRIAKEIFDKTGGVGAEQPSRDFAELMTTAKKAQVVLGKMTEQLAKRFDAEAMVPTQVKGEGRAMEKVTGKYRDCPEKLTDISRSSMVFKSMRALYAALDQMGKALEIVTIKDRFANPTPAGYRDILLNVQLKNGHIVEMQLHHDKMLHAKSGKLEGSRNGHEVYNDQRAVDDAIALGELDLTPVVQEYLDELEKESKGIYYGMWDQICKDEGL